ncbi:unnamed protein product [Pleuronectes platessa]|uniref:Uncharacterized protein n=1 Tax=Pleuronectes platessa TaxID=8262 RepID=A0A9N7YQJ5_PLEPL|nr:unnamed protein product [Pleuronectes platessa]
MEARQERTEQIQPSSPGADERFDVVTEARSDAAVRPELEGWRARGESEETEFTRRTSDITEVLEWVPEEEVELPSLKHFSPHWLTCSLLTAPPIAKFSTLTQHVCERPRRRRRRREAGLAASGGGVFRAGEGTKVLAGCEPLSLLLSTNKPPCTVPLLAVTLGLLEEICRGAGDTSLKRKQSRAPKTLQRQLILSSRLSVDSEKFSEFEGCISVVTATPLPANSREFA